MMSRSQPVALCMFVGLSLGLGGCGGHDDASKNAPANVATASQWSLTGEHKDGGAAAPTLADGPDVCFRAIAKHLGADTKVSEITSFFSSGSAIDSNASKPKGEMTTCTVQYQSPTDPRKLVSTSMNVASGAFAPPTPVEITVAGGDAAKFRLEDYLIPLSKINAAALKAIMDGQKASMDGIYSQYAWSGVRLSSPGAFSDVHTLRLDIEGRLKSNDIKEGGYASITTDGKTITTNFLKP